MGKGNSSNFKTEWDRGFSVPRAFKLDHLHSLESILFQKIFNFFTFILGGQFLFPQRANNGQWGLAQLVWLNFVQAARFLIDPNVESMLRT